MQRPAHAPPACVNSSTGSIQGDLLTTGQLLLSLPLTLKSTQLVPTIMQQRPFLGASSKPKYAKHSLQSSASQMHQRSNRLLQQPQRPVLQQLRASPGPSTDDAAPAPQQQLSAADKDSLLQQLELLRRQLDEAVAQEDYSRAKQLKEKTDALKEQLSPVQQYVQAQLAKLRSGSQAEKAEALKGLGEAGTSDCLADLAALLPDTDLGEAASATMWRIFMRHADTEVVRLMDTGVKFMERGNYPLALEAFEAAATLAPSFAEAHNKRATVLFLLEQYKESIQLCELVLELNPYHFGALSGMGSCYMKLADYKQALQSFKRALQIHPGLSVIQRYVVALKDQLPEETE